MQYMLKSPRFSFAMISQQPPKSALLAALSPLTGQSIEAVNPDLVHEWSRYVTKEMDGKGLERGR